MSSVEVTKKVPIFFFVGYISTLGGVSGQVDGSFNVSIANALSPTRGLGIFALNWSLIAWKTQFPSPGMLTDLTWSPEFAIF